VSKPSTEQTVTSLSRRRFLTAGAGLAGGLFLGKACWHEPRTFVVEKLNLSVAKVPPGPGLRIVHLSDLHLRSLPNHFAAAAATINALGPDLILLTGDYLDQARKLEGALNFCKLLRCEGGIFAVQGNWEYWSRLEGEPLRRKLAKAGVELLIDEQRDLLIRGIPLSILGIDYPSASRSLEKIQQAAVSNRLNIVLSHVPAFGHDRLASVADLILSGHTHGGQIRLPYIHPFYLPRFSAPFVAGLYRVTARNIPLYVNRGMGTSVLPARLFCPPEIALLQLHSPAAGEVPWQQQPASHTGAPIRS
jgi:predicted MPP superfamily phosphohydrolase